MEKKINWGIISCAGIAEGATIPGMLMADNAVLYAISSRSPEKLERFKEKFNPIKAYDNYDALIEDPNIDAIYLPLPNSLHFPWAVKAAMNKKHVLCEKPLAISAEEVRKLKEVFEDNGVLLMEAFASRHNPVLNQVKTMMDEGVIGSIKFIESHFSFNIKDKSNVRFIKELGGGATFDAGAYTIGTIRFLAGTEPIDIKTIGNMDPETDVDTSSCIIMMFENGLMASSYCSFDTYNWGGYTVVGDEGIIEIPVSYNESGSLGIVLKKDGKNENITIEAPNNYMLEIEQFGRCILGDDQPLVTYEDSLGNALVTDLALKTLNSKT